MSRYARLSLFPTRIIFDVECYSFLSIRRSPVPLQANGDESEWVRDYVVPYTAYMPFKLEMI